MDEFKDKKKKLLGLKKQILLMTDNIDKVRKIEGYQALLYYLYYTGAINDFNYDEYDLDDDLTSKYDCHLINSTFRKLDELIDLAPYLSDKCDELIKEYQKNDFCTYSHYYNIKTNKTEMYKNVLDFFKMLGEDITQLTIDMGNNKNIVAMPCGELAGFSLNAIAVDNPCVVLDNIEKCFDYYPTLVHEIGHCYQFYLQRNQAHYESFNAFSETTSIFLERLFLDYLKDKKKYSKEILDADILKNILFFNDLSISKALCKILNEDRIEYIDKNTLDYLPESLKDEIAEDVVKDCGYAISNGLNYKLSEFHYLIGYVIASYFLKKMKTDFSGTWKEYKEFISMVDYYPLKEILDEYFDVNIVKEDIKTFMKNYRNR